MIRRMQMNEDQKEAYADYDGGIGTIGSYGNATQ